MKITLCAFFIAFHENCNKKVNYSNKNFGRKNYFMFFVVKTNLNPFFVSKMENLNLLRQKLKKIF